MFFGFELVTVAEKYLDKFVELKDKGPMDWLTDTNEDNEESTSNVS